LIVISERGRRRGEVGLPFFMTSYQVVSSVTIWVRQVVDLLGEPAVQCGRAVLDEGADCGEDLHHRPDGQVDVAQQSHVAGVDRRVRPVLDHV
jgi:hypothetical protein